MSRYIDADALINDLEYDIAIDEDILGYVGTDQITRTTTRFDKDCKQNAIDLLMNTPSIDIVFCKECIHCADDWNGNQPMFTCELGRCGESVQPNDFCSYGEREGE